MDLGAYTQIKDLEHILAENNIDITRLRGLRLMKNEEPIKGSHLHKQDKLWNKYCGKNVLYVHARQGGGNREYYPIDTKHPMYLEDCDDDFDSTYCDIYYDLNKVEEK